MSVKEIISTVLTEVGDALRSVKSDQAQIEKTQRDAKGKHARIRETVEAKIRERDQFLAAAAPDGELAASIADLVGACGAWWLRDHGPGLVRRLSGQMSSQELNGRTVTTRAQPNLPVERNEAPPFGLLCALDPQGMTEKWVGLLRQIPHESGAPMADRPEQLAQRDAELEELKVVEDQLAQALGVPRREEMVQREHVEARARERAEEKRAHAAWLEEQKAAGRLGTPKVYTAQMHPDRPRGP